MRKTIIAATAAALLLAGCMSSADQDREAKAAVEALGFTDVRMTGFRFTGCGDKDDRKRGFEATGVNGRRLKGVVCGAWTKGWTVRVERFEG